MTVRSDCAIGAAGIVVRETAPVTRNPFPIQFGSGRFMKSRTLILSALGLFLFGGCRSNLLQSFASRDATGMPDPAKIVSGDSLDDRSSAMTRTAGSRKDSSLAAKLFDSNHRRSSTDAADLMARAVSAERSNRLDEAYTLYRQVLSVDPDHNGAHHRLAVISDRRGDFRAAESHYRAAMRNSAPDANLLSDVGYSLLLQKRYRDSEAALNAALNSDPQHEQAIRNLGRLYSEQGDYDAAARAFRRYLPPRDSQQMLAKLFPSGRPQQRMGLTPIEESPEQFGAIRAPRPTRGPNDSPYIVPGGMQPTGPNSATLELERKMAAARERARLKRLGQPRDSRMTSDPRDNSPQNHGPAVTHAPQQSYGDIRDGYDRRPASPARMISPAPNSYIRPAGGELRPRLSAYDRHRLTGRIVRDAELNSAMRDIDRQGSGHSAPPIAGARNWRTAAYGDNRPSMGERNPEAVYDGRRLAYEAGLRRETARPAVTPTGVHDPRQPRHATDQGQWNLGDGPRPPRGELWPENGGRTNEPRGLEERRPIDNLQREDPNAYQTSGMNGQRQRPIAIDGASRDALRLGREMGFGEKMFPVPERGTLAEPAGDRRALNASRQPLRNTRPADDSRFRTANLQRRYDAPTSGRRTQEYPSESRNRFAGDLQPPADSRYAEPEVYRGNSTREALPSRYEEARDYRRER